jgi:hypothetical protein
MDQDRDLCTEAMEEEWQDAINEGSKAAIRKAIAETMRCFSLPVPSGEAAGRMASLSSRYEGLARGTIEACGANMETFVAVRRLLEARDAAMRAMAVDVQERSLLEKIVDRAAAKGDAL